MRRFMPPSSWRHFDYGKPFSHFCEHDRLIREVSANSPPRRRPPCHTGDAVQPIDVCGIVRQLIGARIEV